LKKTEKIINLTTHREMAEWLKAAVLKTVDAYGIRGFESLSLCSGLLAVEKQLLSHFFLCKEKGTEKQTRLFMHRFKIR
jgi:hypothetical protein